MKQKFFAAALVLTIALFTIAQYLFLRPQQLL
jgi:hypothetical protein